MEATELLQTTDARVWAQEFVRQHGGDEELLLGWFANAMCAVRDQLAKQPVDPEAVLAEIIEKARSAYRSGCKIEVNFTALNLMREAANDLAALRQRPSWTSCLGEMTSIPATLAEETG